MVRLGAVQVHGLGARDGHVEGADHAAGAAVKGDEAAVDALARGEGLARRGGVALRDGVVAGGELELDDVTRLRRHRVGREGEGVAADEHGDQARGRREGALGDYIFGTRGGKAELVIKVVSF